MAKGLRSNRKKAIRTLRRLDVRGSDKYLKEETRRISSLQKTAEAGRLARELRSQKLSDMSKSGEKAEPAAAHAGPQTMEIDRSPLKRSGIPVKKKKQLKIQKKKKADGINSLHKKRRKGKR